jgi:hypothetical protein
MSGAESGFAARGTEIFLSRTKRRYRGLSTAQRTVRPFAASVEMTFFLESSGFCFRIRDFPAPRLLPCTIPVKPGR